MNKFTIVLATILFCACAYMIVQTDNSDGAVVASGTCGTNLNWEYDDATTTLTISGSGTTMNDYRVGSSASWNAPWDAYRSTISHIVLNTPNLVRIGNAAFQDMVNVDSVNIPGSVENIGDTAFASTSLKTIDLPSGLKTIGYSSFGGCISLEKLTLPSAITSIGASAFVNTRSMNDTVFVFCSPTSIGAGIFGGTSTVTTLINFGTSDWSATGKTILTPTATGTCGTNLDWAYVGDNTTLYIYGSGTTPNYWSAATSVPWNTYRGSITNVVYDTSKLTSTGNYVFSNCTGIERLTLPTTITTIGDDAFSNCTNLKTVSMPDGVTTINSRAFFSCSSLELTSLPINLKNLNNAAFHSCSSITISEIPETMTKISGFNVFNGCTSITSIHIPASITSMSYGAFANCTNLEHIYWDAINCTIPSTQFPFNGCTKLNDMTFGEYVETIPDNLFNGANSTISKLTFYDSLVSLGEGAFRGSHITSLDAPPDFIGWYKITDDTISQANLFAGEMAYAGYLTGANTDLNIIDDKLNLNDIDAKMSINGNEVELIPFVTVYPTEYKTEGEHGLEGMIVSLVPVVFLVAVIIGIVYWIAERKLEN